MYRKKTPQCFHLFNVVVLLFGAWTVRQPFLCTYSTGACLSSSVQLFLSPFPICVMQKKRLNAFLEKWKRPQVGYKKKTPADKPKRQSFVAALLYKRPGVKSAYWPSHLKSTCRAIAHLCSGTAKHGAHTRALKWTPATFSKPVLRNQTRKGTKA